MPKVSTEPIYIGCELLVRKGDTLLLGMRAKHIFGGGTWGLPGGHMEFGERMIETAVREAKEELGGLVTPDQLRLASIVDDYNGGDHHVHVTFELLDPAWDPKVMEPDCEEWRYFPLDKLPENVLPPHLPIIENYLANRLYK